MPKEVVNEEEVGVWDMIIVEPPRSSFLRMVSLFPAPLGEVGFFCWHCHNASYSFNPHKRDVSL